MRISKSMKNVQYKDTKFHLLGCVIPQEFGWYDNHPQIESIDTSKLGNAQNLKDKEIIEFLGDD